MNFKQLVFYTSMAVVTAVGIFGGGAVAQPVAHWTFDDGLNAYDTATVTDATGNGNDASWQDGTDFSGLGYTAGQIGGAVQLRGGTSEFFEVAAIPQLDGIAPVPAVGVPTAGTGFTLSAWVNVDDSAVVGSQRAVLVSRTVTDIRFDATLGEATDSGQNWGLAIEEDAAPRVDSRFSGSALDSANDSIVRGEWQHVALVWGIDPAFDAANATNALYVDGVLVNSSTPVGNNQQIFEIVTSGSWLLGQDTCCGGREFDGALDDFAVFDSALTAAEIGTLYNNGLAGIDASGANTGTIEFADVNEVGGVTIADYEIIRDNLGLSVTDRSLGDLDGNRRVDLADFQLWLDNAPAPLVAQALGVPEPATASLIGVLAAVAAGVGRRRSHKP